MPTYEYQCSKCGETFEAFQRVSDPPLTDCPKCGAKGTVSRLVSAGAGLIFKGSGFYITDYKRGASSGGAEGNGAKKSESTEKPPEKSTGESSKETKKEKTEVAKTSSGSSSSSSKES